MCHLLVDRTATTSGFELLGIGRVQCGAVIHQQSTQRLHEKDWVRRDVAQESDVGLWRNTQGGKMYHFERGSESSEEIKNLPLFRASAFCRLGE